MLFRKKIQQRILREFFRTHSYHKKNAIDDIVTENPFEFSASWQDRFLKAANWSLRHHMANSDFYKKVCEYKGFHKDRLHSFEEIWDIPFVLGDTFKHYNIETRTADLMKSDLTSSGTSGRKSRILLDSISGNRLLFSIYHTYKRLGMVDETAPANYLAMAYNPELDETLATTMSDVIISNFTPHQEIFYALDKGRGGRIEFLKEEAVEKLRYFVNGNLPVRILGFLHHTCEVIKEYRNRYGVVEFPRGSCILTGGGWKAFGHLYGQDFDVLSFFKENTTIDLKNVRDLYTLSEHPVFYLQCEEHNMHIPNVSLACIRDARTLKRLPFGEKGLVHLYTPMIESCPLLSVLTTDYGYIYESCPCKIGGPYIKILGRAGVTKKLTCTVTAEQYIKVTQ